MNIQKFWRLKQKIGRGRVKLKKIVTSFATKHFLGYVSQGFMKQIQLISIENFLWSSLLVNFEFEWNKPIFAPYSVRAQPQSRQSLRLMRLMFPYFRKSGQISNAVLPNHNFKLFKSSNGSNIITLNIEQTGLCSPFGNRIPTPYFCFEGTDI